MTTAANRLVLAIALLAAGCGSPASRDELPDVATGERPALTTDEAGLWMVMDRVEQDVRTSGRTVGDPALNAYVHGVVCRVAPEYCRDLRVYVLQAADFNASIAPNGFMVVFTGMLLRCRNEAQLAYILAHEVSHYQRRHSLQQWREIRSTVDALLFPQIALSAVGLGPAAMLAQLAAVGSILQFSRDQEREADTFGLERAAAAGYDPGEAADVWERLIAEKEAAEDDDPFIFFATHPPSEERLATLRAQAAQLTAAGRAGVDREEDFRNATLPFRGSWLRDELRRREYGRMLVVLDQLTAQGVRLGELEFYRGELYRLRADEGDDRRAIEAYRAALAAEDAPPETHRGLAEMHRRRGDGAAARLEFAEYLRLSPGAPDRAMIETYLRSPE